jgi:hypothetical protein
VELEKDTGGVLDSESSGAVRGYGLYRVDLSAEVSQIVNGVDQVDHHRATTGFATPRITALEIFRRLEQTAHRVDRGNGAQSP